MWKITKGYKEGRAVMYYDLSDTVDNTLREKVHKDEVVKLCENGMIHNTKIQWWEGKPIVRCSDSFEIVKLGNSGEVLGKVDTVKRNSKVAEKEKQAEQAIRAEVVGKLSKKKKESIAYAGYDRQFEVEQFQVQSSINYSTIDTVGALFVMIANDYKLKDTEEYLKQFAKKVNPDKKLSSMAKNMVLSIQDSISTYLMNMAYKEIKETWIKYRVK